jgi:4-diphosphocytidyl-2C-methyl-D-erythritol kinase
VRVALPARAKLNLDLSVVRRRDDGTHEIRTQMQAIELHDLLQIEPAGRTSFAVRGLAVPEGVDNIVLKALDALEQAAGRHLPTEFELDKRIPPGAGLGGASSDAAAALRALKVIHGLDLDLAPIAAGVGADVPFFLAGGTALAEGKGELLTQLPTEPACFAVAWPGIELSTAAVYKAWDDVGGDQPNELRRAAERVEPMVQDFAARLGHHWQMTGSGSAFFRRCTSQEEGLQLVANLDCWTAVTHSVGKWA